MDDEIEILRSLQPRVNPLSSLSLEEKRSELMAVITNLTTGTNDLRPVGAGLSTTAPARRAPRRRAWVAAAAALVTLGGSAAAFAVITHDPASTTSVACGDVFVDAVSGDPVADCADVWRRTKGAEPPPLAAYRTSDGGITVIPADAMAPGGWERVAEGFRQDGRLIELTSTLDDVGAGLASDCLPLDRAQPIAEQAISNLKLTGWRAMAENGSADGRQTCTVPIVEPDQYRVLLVPVAPGTGGDLEAVRVMAKGLQARLGDTCVPLKRGAEIARQASGRNGASAPDVQVHTVAKPGSSCATVTVNVGGSVQVIVRGPAER